MKKMIFLFGLSILISILSLSAQERLPYKSFESFRNDTLAFIEYNFETRADCYVGKTVADVIKDMQLPVLSYGNILFVVGEYPNPQVVQISLFVHHTIKGEESPLFDYYVGISLKDPIVVDDKWEQFIKSYDKSNWVPQHYDFFKNLVVKRVLSNPYIIMKRENDKPKANNNAK